MRGSQTEHQTDTNKSEILVQIIKEGCEFFKCEEGKTWVLFFIQDKRNIAPIKSKLFRGWVSTQWGQEFKKTPPSTAITNVIDFLDSETLVYGETKVLHRRITQADGAFWYYLDNQEKQAVRIDALGWRVSEGNLPYFRETTNSQEQVSPSMSGDTKKLLDFVTLKDEKQQLLFLVSVITCFVPNISHPAFVFHGCKGSSKTTTMRFVQKLIDPSIENSSSLPRNEYDLGLQLSQSSFVAYDNLTQIQPWQSDMLCRAVTGGSVSKRENYTDTDRVRVNFQGCIALNGINLVVSKSDLLDRSIIFELERLHETKRKPLQQLEAEFAQALPDILGGIFSTLSKAISEFHNLSLPNLPRMADYCKWGCAVAMALGYKAEKFVDAYDENIKIAQNACIESSQLALALEAFAAVNPEWEGSVGELHEYLGNILFNMNMKRDKTFPASASKLMSAVREILPDIQALGINVKELGRKSAGVMVRITNQMLPVLPGIIALCR